jgi:hypothetical protein
MKKISTLIVSIAAICSANAQQLTFQGKLYQNNQPITATGSFQFFINSGGVNWSETHPSISINKGLYAVVLGSINALPLNLFKNSQSIPMEVRYNNALIDNVTVYAPFERDYTVPENIKDGISWGEVSNKPSIDTSVTNEIQTLSIKGSTLSISQGNSVTLPGSSGNNTVIGNFTVFDTTATTMPGVGQTGNCSQDAFSSTIWQSFLATSSGKLRTIKIQLGSISSSDVIINIYSGVGVSQAIAGPIQIPVSGGLNYRFLNLSSLNVSILSGQIYTFSIAPTPNGTQSIVGRNFLTADPYPNGVSSYGSNADLCFEIYTDRTNPSAFTVLSNGYVGISNSSPSSQLTVAGRIEDATGFVTPVGTIIAYGGRTVPKGWLMCDGSSVSRTQYPELYNAIDTTWGRGSQAKTTFNLPDLRGLFLRGVDGSAGRDPDVAARTAMNTGGNNKNNVGSYQGDEFKSHNHYTHNWTASWGNYAGYHAAGSGADYGARYSGSAGGNETRPKNAYVYYIIKY